jgi:alpha-galactosidase
MLRSYAYPTAVASVIVLALAVTPSARVLDRRAQLGDAFVDADAAANAWTIGNDSIRYVIAFGRQGTISGVSLTIGGEGRAVNVATSADTSLIIGNEVLPLGAPDSAFVLDGAAAAEGSHFVSLSIRFKAAAYGVRATRHYIVYPGAAAVELWTDLESADTSARSFRDLNAVHLTLPAGDIEYVTGLNAPVEEGGSFARRRHRLQADERLTLGSSTLSSETTLPLITVDTGAHRVFTGLVWSGAWQASLERHDETLAVSFGLPSMSAEARLGQPVEGPHAFVGATPNHDGADIAALTRFTRASRGGRPFPAATTFNTWFVHGVNLDEEIVRRDMDYAASIGIELFQLDAGWYERESPENAFDFTTGLGTWRADPARFPSGLAQLTHYAHEQGLQFGLWVEPERVALSTVGGEGLADESYLAMQHGFYQPGVPNEEVRDGQICLAYAPARQWVQRRLIELIEDVRPDNLKWDFNRWVHCTRPDHGHPVDGGNYEHTRALYEVLAAIRARFPDLTIENCAGGGHRLDFAMARLTDTAWMDDRTAPSMHVRRNLHGLLALFPASYLFSYVMPHETEPLRGAPDLPLIVRSRMPGVVGLAASLDQLSEGEMNVLHQEFELAKRLRGAQHQAVTFVLTPRRSETGEWEVIQQLIPESGISYVFAVGERASHSIRVQLHGLVATWMYELRSADRGFIANLRGADLIANGLEIGEAPESAAQILVLEPHQN